MSTYKTAVLEIHPFLFKTSLHCTLKDLTAQGYNGPGVLFPMQERSGCCNPGKRCQSVYSEEGKSLRMNSKSEGSKGTAGLG